MEVLFVCTGNTCRSPLAEVLLRSLLDKRGIKEISVASAGICAAQGSPASPGSISVLTGTDDLAAHLARQVDPGIVAHASLILTMTAAHRDILTKQFPDWAGKIHTLGEYAWGQDQDIPDPFGGGKDVYLATRAEIEAAVEIVAGKITEVSK